jgi:PAS domain S-box-containing protein
MEEQINILHLEDDPADAELIQANLEFAEVPFKITRVQSAGEFSNALHSGGYDVILADYHLPSYDGISALHFAQAQYPHIPFIFVSGTLGEDAAIEGLTRGATDYVLKNKLARLVPALKRALNEIENQKKRQQAEEELRKSEEKFRALAENIPNVVYQCKNDARYTFLYLNKPIEDLTGYPREEFLEKGLSFFDLYHPDDLPNIPTPEENDVTDANRNPFHITYRIRHKSGEWRWVDEWGTGVTNAEGKVELLEGIMIDISERKRAEEALRESEQRYRLLVNLSPDAIGVYDDNGIVLANPAAVQLVGAQSESDLIGKSILDFMDPTVHAVAGEVTNRMRETSQSTEFVEEKFTRLDGRRFDAEVAGVPFRYQGRDYVQFVARDITERKRHEREHEAIITVSTALRQATTKSEILNVILDQSMQLFEADGAVLVLPNSQTGGLIDEMGRGRIGEKLTGLAVPSDKGISSWVIKNRKSYLNNNAHTDPLFYRPELLGESHCVACSPLIAKEKAIGALWIARQQNLEEQDLRLLNAITDIAANAVHRVMLHEQTEQQLHHLLALHQIDLAISTNFDLDITLKVILNHVRDELEVDAAGVMLLNPVTHTLDYASGIGFRTPGIEQSHVRVGDGCAGQAAREYRTVSCPDLKASGGAFSRAALITDEKFVSHYATPLVVKGQVKGVLELFHRKTFEPDQEWINYFETLATQAAIAIESASLFENLQRSNLELMLAYDATIEGWSRALDLRDKETEGHTQRVTEMVLDLAEKMNLNDVEKINLRRGALLHDIGKMGVPDAILLKPGALTESEWEIMRMHPVYAYQMLSPIPYLKHALEIPYAHHEKWDGTGYPRGLKAEQIPLAARMFSIVDVYDALTSDRPYRAAWTPEAAYHHIEEESGKHFDPRLVKIFLESK